MARLVGMMTRKDGQAGCDNEQVIPVIPPFPPHPGLPPAVPPNQHKLIDVPRTRTNRCASVQSGTSGTQIDRFPG